MNFQAFIMSHHMIFIDFTTEFKFSCLQEYSPKGESNI